MTPKNSTHHSLSRRVFATVFAVAMLVVVVFSLAGTAYVQGRLVTLAHEELDNQSGVVAAALNSMPDDKFLLNHLDLSNTRITLIDTDGTVLFDSEADVEDMPNHASRPEVVEAFETGRGDSERSSSTLGEIMLYEAVRLDNGTVLRLAQEQDGYLSILVGMMPPLLGLVALGVIVSVMAARLESRAIIAPLLEVDLDHPVRNIQDAYSEMIPMLDRIETQRQELKRQMRVLADNDRMRREFTANITHELKTPLTAISGYAELIASGMVADEEDQRDFARRIHKEAGRLTALVNDILTLSSLDEAERGDAEVSNSVLGSREPVDLPRTIDTVYHRLDTVADVNGITLQLRVEPAIVFGVPRLLDELVYNLASNAIRYNKPHGSVTLRCGMESGAPYVSVEDTGIGIAPEEQDKIFERFYRVDKSRSKARGGTGLGLAIVKHAAMFHDATISVDSTLGEGTTITVRFPKEAMQIEDLM
ncbi:two-component sensor histidine kinase [Collinsella sp. An271]|uniref:sensor histidine kinase n=1 Tax=Collinsella sp. An271 TaxID=1965616 RepID=UPI000B3A3DFF|nr:ATP-binding protein [Collinsella sp. An271]OUO60053.1 two-component sensor histidine kinase [Collinsella sp. An271]